MTPKEAPSHQIDFDDQDRKQLESILHCLEHPGVPFGGIPDCIESKRVGVKALVEVAIAVVLQEKYPKFQLNWYYVKLQFLAKARRKRAATIIREILEPRDVPNCPTARVRQMLGGVVVD